MEGVWTLEDGLRSRVSVCTCGDEIRRCDGGGGARAGRVAVRPTRVGVAASRGGVVNGTTDEPASSPAYSDPLGDLEQRPSSSDSLGGGDDVVVVVVVIGGVGGVSEGVTGCEWAGRGRWEALRNAAGGFASPYMGMKDMGRLERCAPSDIWPVRVKKRFLNE